MPTAVASGYIHRRAEESVLESLADTRVVLVNGARQAGKSTLVRRVGKRHDAAWFSLDDADTRMAAAQDPASFVRLAARMIVDEIQRDPELLLSIKSLVDEIPTPGRFLLTGSARVLGLRDLPDTLTGRMHTIELWPLSQGEIDGTRERFVDLAFDRGPDLQHESAVTRDEYIERVTRGGFPDAIRKPEPRRATHLQNYVADIVNRDVVQLSNIDRGPDLRALILALAGRSGGLIAPETLGAGIGLPASTTRRYLRLLEEVYLIKRVPAWTRRITARSVQQDKVAFVDSGVATVLLGLNAARLRKPGAPLGGLLEGFVGMEIARQLTWAQERADLFHYRTKDKVEVDFVLQNWSGRVIGVEVKASASPKPEDFRGLRHLAERIGEDFVAGYVLHTGPRTLPFGPNLRAIPISALWQA
jgi:predicted AAA+ superfamily ATPase